MIYVKFQSQNLNINQQKKIFLKLKIFEFKKFYLKIIILRFANFYKNFGK